MEKSFLIAVRDSVIYGISLNPEEKSNDAMVPIAGVQNGYDVDFDDSEQMIYWVENPVSIFGYLEQQFIEKTALIFLFPVPSLFWIKN